MTKYPLFIILSIFALSVSGQPGALKLTTTRNDDKSVDFSYEKKSHGTYYLEVYLTSLNNTVHNGYRGVIKNNRGKIFRLRPQNENASIGFNYSYKYLRGSPNPKFDKDFRYLLPYRGTAQVEDLSNLNVEYFGARQAKDWRALMFKLTPGDTIYAARKGLVVEVVNHHLPDTTNAYSYYPLVNYIIVEHPDGTFAKYTGFYSEQINVLPGQTIFPNDPIGIVAQYDSEGIAQLRFQVYYLNFSNLRVDVNKTLSTQRDRNAYINPVFLTESGEEKLVNRKSYQFKNSVDLVKFELTKRERKLRGIK